MLKKLVQMIHLVVIFSNVVKYQYQAVEWVDSVNVLLKNIFDKILLIFFYRDPETILRTLAPMFEIDFYLPRAFMSILRLEKLTVVKTKLLPPEVVMASLYFFTKTEYFETDLKKKVIDIFFQFGFYITFNLISHLS